MSKRYQWKKNLIEYDVLLPIHKCHISKKFLVNLYIIWCYSLTYAHSNSCIAIFIAVYPLLLSNFDFHSQNVTFKLLCSIKKITFNLFIESTIYQIWIYAGEVNIWFFCLFFSLCFSFQLDVYNSQYYLRIYDHKK